jgi:single-strand DNA-binding protein
MLNVAIEMGRLVVTPELKHTPAGIAFSSFSIAVDRDYKKEGQDRETDFFDIVCWRSTAEYVCKYFKKGQLIVAKGSLQTRTYTDTHKDKRKVLEIIADDVYPAGYFEKKDSIPANTEQ